MSSSPWRLSPDATLLYALITSESSTKLYLRPLRQSLEEEDLASLRRMWEARNRRGSKAT